MASAFQPRAHTPRIVIAGGGAGGLELATRLGHRLGRRGKAEITLIDVSWTHIWKPLLHEVAAGTIDAGEHQLEYLAQAHHHHFRFRLGRVDGLDRGSKRVLVAPTFNETGEEITPRRAFPYDLLVFAVGSVSNDFGVPGAREHCLFLDTTQQAQGFQRYLLETLLRAHTRGAPVAPGQLDVAIVGGGATGIELAAQLHTATRQLAAYGLDEIRPEQDVHITLLEAAPRLAAALPPRLSAAVQAQLERLGVVVHTGERVVEVTERELRTASGRTVAAAIKVWCAGIEAPSFLAVLDGLETTGNHQLVVNRRLETTGDADVYAFGDCAACPLDDEGLVPPRAQAAHQQATYLARALARRLRGRLVTDYRYRDYGSLIALGRYSTVGSLMGHLTGSVMVSGFVARIMYLSLHQMHQVALHGWIRTLLLNVANLLRRGVQPQIKLH